MGFLGKYSDKSTAEADFRHFRRGKGRRDNAHREFSKKKIHRRINYSGLYNLTRGGIEPPLLP